MPERVPAATAKKTAYGNVVLALGNLLSIYARNNNSGRQALKCLSKTGMSEDLMVTLRKGK